MLAALATQIRVILTEIAQREVEAGRQVEDIPKQDNSSWYRQQKKQRYYALSIAQD